MTDTSGRVGVGVGGDNNVSGGGNLGVLVVVGGKGGDTSCTTKASSLRSQESDM
mgnify:CR=1 FL=1